MRGVFIRHLNVLNLALSALIVLFYVFALRPRLEVKGLADVPDRSGQSTVGASLSEGATEMPSFMEFASISEDNLFHPERKTPPKGVGSEGPKDVEMVLYGTLINGRTRYAFMEDMKSPYSTPGRGKRQKSLRVGDSLSGYLLAEIEHDRVVMKRGQEILVLKILDSEKPKSRGAEAKITASKENPEEGKAAAVVTQTPEDIAEKVLRRKALKEERKNRKQGKGFRGGKDGPASP